MVYRNGTYIAFHAGGTNDPIRSDIKYYRLLKAWHEHDSTEFKFINSHEKFSAVRDSSAKETLRGSLRARINNSKNFVLIVGNTTRYDTDWVPFEISHAIDRCGLPLIAAYPGYDRILAPAALRSMWPAALASRIDAGVAKVIHIPFKRLAIDDAISQFNLSNRPPHGLWHYSREAHRAFGLPA
jgi:hypothetical protein